MLQKKEIRQTVLKERIRAAEERRQHRRLHRNAFAIRNTMHACFTISDNPDIPVCVNGFRNVYGLFRTSWMYLKKHSLGLEFNAGPITHGNHGLRSRYLSSRILASEPFVIEFLNEVVSAAGEPYATRFIREVTGHTLRDAEEGSILLPSNFTKRSLYISWCFSMGYKIKATAKGSFGPVSEYSLREFDPELWPEGSVAQDVCSWRGFCFHWKTHFPLLKIRNPCEDTCGACVRLRNSWHVLDRITGRRRAPPPADDDDSSIVNDVDIDDASDVSGGLEEALNSQEYPHEYLINKAHDHVRHAKAQRALASQRISEAKAQASNNHDNRRFVFLPFF